MSLANPVKVFVNENKDIAFNLQQEFIRVRPHMEADREAIVAGLLTVYTLYNIRNMDRHQNPGSRKFRKHPFRNFSDICRRMDGQTDAQKRRLHHLFARGDKTKN